MTSDEIRAAIERLETMEPSDYVGVGDVANVVWKFAGDMVPAVELRYTLINLLRQADPDTHIELPRDADGTPIHVGDEMQWRDSERFIVVAIGDNAVFFDYDEGYEYSTPDCVRHYRNPTVEDVLREFVNRVMSYNEDEDDGDAMISDYAAKLREVMADE